MSSRSALIIDDEPDTTTYLATLLTDNGWTARTANSVEDGLALARAQVPDVVLLDLMMPERGGLSALVELRKTPELSSVPIVIVSGIQETLTSDFRTFLKRFKYRKPDAFLDKPVVPDELLQTLDQLTQSKAD
jgi:twitching motility two-component system response regulator PilH